jgi:hypothetical protein
VRRASLTYPSDVRARSSAPKIVGVVVAAFVVGASAMAIEWAVAPAATPPTMAAPPPPPPAPTPTVTPEVIVHEHAPPAEPSTTSAPDTTVYMERTTPPIPTTSASHGSVTKQAMRLLLTGDSAGARHLLEQRVFGPDLATPEEVKLLRGACKSEHDDNCLAAIERRYPKK